MNQPTIDAQITFLYARDLMASARFYEETLGLRLALDQSSCRIYRTGDGGAFLGICQSERPITNEAAIILTLVMQDVDGFYERLIASGVDCEHAPRLNERYGIYHFFVRDPDGYRIEAQRFIDADWDKLNS